MEMEEEEVKPTTPAVDKRKKEEDDEDEDVKFGVSPGLIRELTHSVSSVFTDQRHGKYYSTNTDGFPLFQIDI